MTKHKIYIAHNFEARGWIKNEILSLIPREIKVTSRWLTSTYPTKEEQLAMGIEKYKQLRQQHGAEDLADLLDADEIVFFAEQYRDRTGKGKHFELGYAHASALEVSIIGAVPGVNDYVFLYEEGFDHFPNFQEWLQDTKIRIRF